MTRDELLSELDLTEAKLDELIGLGLPVERGGKFDFLRVVGWIVLDGRGHGPRYVDQKYLAEYFGKSVQSVRNWKDQGMPTVDSDRYDLDACVKWRFDILRISTANEDLLTARAHKARLDLQERLGELAPVEPYLRRIERRVGEQKAVLNQLPDLVAKVAVDEGVAPEAVARLRARVRQLLERTYEAIADASVEKVTEEDWSKDDDVNGPKEIEKGEAEKGEAEEVEEGEPTPDIQ